jgi:sugar lactone lactonase YvrE
MRRLFPALALCLLAPALFAQSILTVAGGGTDAGQLATNIPAHGPRGLLIDRTGNLYYVESAGRVRRIDAATQRVADVAGNGGSGFSGDGGPATLATLNAPGNIAFDPDGNLFITERDNNRIRRVDAKTGVITTFAEDLRGPWGIAIGGGYVWFSEYGYNGNRIQRINLQTKVMELVAGAEDGHAGFADGPGKDALFDGPLGIAIDGSGNVYVADPGNHRIRRIDANFTVTTIANDLELPLSLAFDPAGNLNAGVEGKVIRIDKSTGAISTLAEPFGLIWGLAFLPNGDAFIEDDANGVIQKWSASTHEVTLYAGGGSFIGDGRVAAAAILANPLGIAVNKRGDLFIADSSNTVVRKVDAANGTIRTVAGQVYRFYAEEQEGANATEAVIGGVLDVALDSKENLYTADPHNRRVWKIDGSGKISTYAKADDLYPTALAFDANDNLYIADREQHVVRRVDAQSKAMTVVAGTLGKPGNGANELNTPVGVAVDADGNVYIADQFNASIRKLDVHTNTLATYADGAEDKGDFFPQHIAIQKSTGDLYIADQGHHAVRKIDAQSKAITTVAGSAPSYLFGDFGGDNGAATAAKLNLGYELSGIAITPAGDLFVSDSTNNRVRAVYACRALDATSLTTPADGSSRSPVLSWRAVPGAFRYDVQLDTVNPPQKIVAADVAETSFTAGNLLPSTRYYWRVIAKGDAFCSPRATSASAVGSFTTSGGCALGSFDTTSPADNAAVSTPTTLTWQALNGAASYDVYLGPANPPALFAANVKDTSLQVTARGTQFWFVVAHAACDAQITASTPVHTFNAGQGCQGNPSVAIEAPADQAGNVASPVTLSWTSSNATGFNVDFGTTNPPPAFATGLSTNRLTINSLTPGATYFWRVTATGCDGSAQTAIARFTARSCGTPSAPSFTFTPATVTAGATYTVVWSAAAGLDAGGGYLVERSTSATFVTILDAQVTQSRAAAFVAGSPGTLYHRVRAVPACDPSKPGPVSDVRAVTVTTAPPNVVFTVPPAAAITALGERIDALRGSFTLENLGSAPLQVIVGRQELGGAPPFFSIVDPSSTDSAFVTLQPRAPHAFEIRYAGPPNDVARSYEGVIFAAATGTPLAVTPYAFVNLKVGGSGSAVPQLAEYAAFSAFPTSGDDTTRPPLQITITNPGTTPMELAAEIGPEVWLVPESGWNTTPLAPGASRTVNLSTRRSRAPGGSALPRYTYFTVRTKSGGSARMLVQDNDTLSVANSRAIRLDSTDSTLIVPEVVSTSATTTRMWITNIGGEAVQAELTYTPEGADGFDANRVRRAIVVVPPNDVATVTDPLVQIFGAARPARGSIEVRLPRERFGFVSVTSSTSPTVARGAGARAGAPQTLIGPTSSLTLVETSGVDGAQVTVRVFAANGTQLTTLNANVPRYGVAHFDNLPAETTRIDVSVANGSGASVVAVGTNGTLATSFAQSGGATALARRMIAPDDTPLSVTTVVPVLPATTSKTEVIFSAPSGLSSTFSALFRLANGAQGAEPKTFTVPSGVSIVFHDVTASMFNLGTAQPGSIAVSASNGGRVTAMLEKGSGSAPSSTLPAPTSASDLLTGATLLSQRPLFLDGLEQSTDTTRGSRWLLLLNEVGGASGTVTVRLYEAANRTTPIAAQDFAIGANQQLTLDTVFASLGLDSPERRKDRTNVQVVVLAANGAARVAATAIAVDNRTGDTQAHALTPGAALPSASVVTPVLPTGDATTRRRAAGH